MLEGFQKKVMRFLFSGAGGLVGSGARIEIYETLELLLSNGVQIEDALSALYEVESDDGKKPNEVRAIVLNDCLEELKGGRRLWQGMLDWVPDPEMQLIRAGETSGDVAATLKDAIRLIEAKRKIVFAAIGGLLYPILLSGLICTLLYQIATKMVPQFARILPPDRWTGAARILRGVADFVVNYGVISLVLLGIFSVWVFWSLPNVHQSRARVFLDRLPPWSVYRMLHGSTFLLTMAVMLRAGVRIEDIFEMVGSSGSPWLKTRVLAALDFIKQGKKPGMALYMTGYHFPDKRAVAFLRLLAEQEGFDEKLSGFADRWLVKSELGIVAASRIALYAGIITAGGVILLILSGVMSIQGLAQTALQSGRGAL